MPKLQRKINAMRVWILIFLLPLAASNKDDIVRYLEKVITEGRAEALNYQLPNNASEYKVVDEQNYHDYGTYDFIIVGGGVGGSVVANRLSEVEKYKVLVLEAGDWENEFIKIPGMFSFGRRSKYNWNFKTTPQDHGCLGMVGKQCLYPTGKGFGGTSLINVLFYGRGNKADFDKWEEDGNTGWCYDKILKYFKKSEKTTIPDPDEGYHGFEGPLRIEYHEPLGVHFSSFLNASEELGYKQVDYNGKSQIGVSRSQLILKNGERLSHGSAYLRPIVGRKNLYLSGNSYVTKILLDRVTKRATGVLFSKNGTKYIAKASKEIILCAGVFMTPQILMLSGIGPKEDLQNSNIDTIVDLPVGKHLHDHPSFLGLNIFSNYQQQQKNLTEQICEYLDGRGPLAIAANLQGGGCFETNLAEFEGVPNMELLLIPPNRTYPLTQSGFGFTDLSYQSLIKDISDQSSTYNIHVVCLQPKSFGEVKLRSNSPYDYPLIDSQIFSHPKDMDVLLEGVRFIQKILKTKSSQQIGAKMGFVDHPDCRKYTPDTDDYWYCHIGLYSVNLDHPMGTAKMAPRNKGGVTDPSLRVHGIKNLRIGDGSAIPWPFSGHPVAAITMIAEKLSDLIKEDYIYC